MSQTKEQANRRLTNLSVPHTTVSRDVVQGDYPFMLAEAIAKTPRLDRNARRNQKIAPLSRRVYGYDFEGANMQHEVMDDQEAYR